MQALLFMMGVILIAGLRYELGYAWTPPTCKELSPFIIKQAEKRAVEFPNFTILKLYKIEGIPPEGIAFQHLGEIPRGGKIGDYAIQQAVDRRREGEPYRVYPAEKGGVVNCMAIALLRNGLRVPIHFYLFEDEDGDYLTFYKLQ